MGGKDEKPVPPFWGNCFGQKKNNENKVIMAPYYIGKTVRRSAQCQMLHGWRYLLNQIEKLKPWMSGGGFGEMWRFEVRRWPSATLTTVIALRRRYRGGNGRTKGSSEEAAGC